MDLILVAVISLGAIGLIAAVILYAASKTVSNTHIRANEP